MLKFVLLFLVALVLPCVSFEARDKHTQGDRWLDVGWLVRSIFFPCVGCVSPCLLRRAVGSSLWRGFPSEQGCLLERSL